MSRIKNSLVFDSYAVLTFLKEEPGWQRVRNLLWDAYKKSVKLYINSVNLGEVYYIAYREYGIKPADQVLSMIKSWPLEFVPVKEELAIVAGRMKAENKISYADAYVVATALIKRATILTGDKEFKEIEDLLAIEWLPKNKS